MRSKSRQRVREAIEDAAKRGDARLSHVVEIINRRRHKTQNRWSAAAVARVLYSDQEGTAD
jgi:hypothetical protein